MTAPTCATCRYYDHPEPWGHYGHCWWGRYHLNPKWADPIGCAVLVTPDDGRVCHTWHAPDTDSEAPA